MGDEPAPAQGRQCNRLGRRRQPLLREHAAEQPAAPRNPAVIANRPWAVPWGPWQRWRAVPACPADATAL